MARNYNNIRLPRLNYLETKKGIFNDSMARFSSRFHGFQKIIPGFLVFSNLCISNCSIAQDLMIYKNEGFRLLDN
jgi:hypothetical protein